jgi:hypothetical protein
MNIYVRIHMYVYKCMYIRDCSNLHRHSCEYVYEYTFLFNYTYHLYIQSSEGRIRQQIRSARTFICILREGLYPHPYPYPMLSGLLVLVPVDLYAVYAQGMITLIYACM